jgi:hypothetical protein
MFETLLSSCGPLLGGCACAPVCSSGDVASAFAPLHCRRARLPRRVPAPSGIAGRSLSTYVASQVPHCNAHENTRAQEVCATHTRSPHPRRVSPRQRRCRPHALGATAVAASAPRLRSLLRTAGVRARAGLSADVSQRCTRSSPAEKARWAATEPRALVASHRARWRSGLGADAPPLVRA